MGKWAIFASGRPSPFALLNEILSATYMPGNLIFINYLKLNSFFE
jgi:hypothetical protein